MPNEESLFATIGRLYVAVLLRDNEIQRLKRVVSEYEARASSPDEPSEEIPNESV